LYLSGRQWTLAHASRLWLAVVVVVMAFMYAWNATQTKAIEGTGGFQAMLVNDVYFEDDDIVLVGSKDSFSTEVPSIASLLDLEEQSVLFPEKHAVEETRSWSSEAPLSPSYPEVEFQIETVGPSTSGCGLPPIRNKRCTTLHDQAETVVLADCACKYSDGLETSHVSLGSQLHHLGECTPCKFFRSRRGCRDGLQCTLCHFPHSNMTYSSIKRAVRQTGPTNRERLRAYGMLGTSLANDTGIPASVAYLPQMSTTRSNCCPAIERLDSDQS